MDSVDISTYESAPVLSFRSIYGQIGFGKQVAKREIGIGTSPLHSAEEVATWNRHILLKQHLSQASGYPTVHLITMSRCSSAIQNRLLLTNHSSRVDYFGALAGQRRSVKFIPIFSQRLLLALGLLFAALLPPGLLQAQNAVTGGLTGVVQDSSGAIVPGANVKIVDTATNATINVTTNDAGRYSAPLLKPSKYQVSATATGLSASPTMRSPYWLARCQIWTSP